MAPQEQFLLFSTIFYNLILDFCVITRTRFFLRDKRLFEKTEVEITRVDCIYNISLITAAHATELQHIGKSRREISRVPGLHSIGTGPIAFPSFLFRSVSVNTDPRKDNYGCPSPNPNCPSKCRKTDEFGCKLCICTSKPEGHVSCPDPPSNCPVSCRKTDDKGCHVCRCQSEKGKIFPQFNYM